MIMYRECILCFTALVVVCDGLPFGAPEAACLDMRPRELSPGYGHGYTPSESRHPFTFRYRRVTRNRYNVMLRGPAFKGFFIQARDDFDNPIGDFYNFDTTRIRHVDCGLGTNAVTHTNTNPDTRVMLRWTDPDNYGLDRFIASVVLQKETYWVKIQAYLYNPKDPQDVEDFKGFEDDVFEDDNHIYEEEEAEQEER